ncbi:GNAT family N-acetyltransferase [Paenibacillus sp. TRM 82003]|nr:GNAT family N-acetyltransferase [Paenibacillus sp. TRM 82003]
MMEVIRITTTEQLKKAFQIRIEVFVEEQKVPPEEEMDRYDDSPAAAKHVLLMDGDEPAATGRYIEYKPDTAKMQRIAVRSPYRERGVGRKLMSALEDWAREEGYAYSVLDAQVQAEPFYKKQGYETISTETFLDAGIPHVRMRKPLTSV